MYQGSSQGVGGYSSLDNVVSYQPSPSSFSFEDAINEAYSCEGCQKIMARMYGKEDMDLHHDIVPIKELKEYSRTFSKSQGYHMVFGNGYLHVGKSYDSSSGAPSLYNGSMIGNEASYQRFSRTYDFQPSVFLKPIRPKTPFVENENQILELAQETFLQLTGEQLPKNLSISILPKEELRQKHAPFGKWSEGIRGFAINGNTLKQVFIKQDHLDSLMMVLGHEIGHVFTPVLTNKHDEEAKAFSFAEAWAKCIKRHDIANLASSIKDENDWEPARNGLHDVAFFFVKKMMGRGIAPMQLHWDLAKGYRSLFNAYQ
ncbi:MAG TPA: hypothetical protein VJB12_05160 [Candidatus Nanoarchaeia archaeon]|nr:hypothetical protein [Candidatus Nanoarchaeia archaeon]